MYRCIAALMLTVVAISSAQESSDSLFEVGQTYRFALNNGARLYARFVRADSLALYVVPADETDMSIVQRSSIESYVIAKPRRHLVTFSILGLVRAAVVPTYFTLLSEHWIVGGGPRYYMTSGRFGGLIEGRVYPFGESPSGFYIAPNVGFVPKFPDFHLTPVDAATAGIMVGWQWFHSYNFTSGLGLGFDIVIPTQDRAYNSEPYAIGMWRFDVGSAW